MCLKHGVGLEWAFKPHLLLHFSCLGVSLNVPTRKEMYQYDNRVNSTVFAHSCLKR